MDVVRKFGQDSWGGLGREDTGQGHGGGAGGGVCVCVCVCILFWELQPPVLRNAPPSTPPMA